MQGAFDEALYDQLRSLAASHLSRERHGGSVQVTTLVHEAWLRLRDREPEQWRSRRAFFAVAARTMRRLLVDRARRRQVRRDELDRARVEFDDRGAIEGTDVVEVDAALRKLESVAARAARVVELRFFGGLTMEEIGDELELSARTVGDDWAFARAWLHKELRRNA